MSKIEYKKMSLFDAPPSSYLVHACNCRGVWGSGIAKEFKQRFPSSFEQYKSVCLEEEVLGAVLVTNEKVVCLMTSKNYGKLVDEPYQILVNTTFALTELMFVLNELEEEPITIYSNKFNSGLFNVPWEQTEYIINSLIKSNNLIEKWIVCDPNL